MVDTVTISKQDMAELIAEAIAKQRQTSDYADATANVNQFSDSLNDAQGKTNILSKAFGGAAAAVSAAAGKAINAAQNRTGNIPAGMDNVGIPKKLQIPMTEAYANLEISDELARAGAILDSIQVIGDTAATLNLTQEQLANFATQRMDELRATGLLGDEALDQLVKIRERINQDTDFSVEEFRALGIELDKLANYSSSLSNLLGPSFQGDIEGTTDAMVETVKRQSMLAQTTGMSIEEQIKATEAIMETPGALARQMDLITNPKMTKALVGFSNTVAAIGASDLAEGFISGVGLPTPGNEIEAALKPMSTALMAQINEATIRGDEASVRRLSAELQTVYARESQAVTQQLGRFAPYLGDEFGFLRKDLENQRATMLGVASNQNFVSEQRAAAQQQINTRLDDSVLSALATLERSQADLSTTLLKAINMMSGEGGAVEKAAIGASGLTTLTQELTDALTNVFDGTLSDLRVQSASVSIDEAIIEIKGKISSGEATGEDLVMLDKLEKLVVELQKIADGSLKTGAARALMEELKPYLDPITKKRQEKAIDDAAAAGVTVEQVEPGIGVKLRTIASGLIGQLINQRKKDEEDQKVKGAEPFFTSNPMGLESTLDNQQSSIVPLLEEQNKLLSETNSQMAALISTTGQAGYTQAKAVEKADTLNKMTNWAGA